MSKRKFIKKRDIEYAITRANKKMHLLCQEPLL